MSTSSTPRPGRPTGGRASPSTAGACPCSSYPRLLNLPAFAPHPTLRSWSMPADGDRVLAAEQEYLDQARELLRLMREDVLALPALAGDWVSREYLRSGLARRAQELADLPDAPLCCGRIDYAAGTVPGAASPAGEQFHSGRRHVHDRAGQPVVIDWRAPVARPFYQATPAEPAGVARRRRFGFAGGRLTAYEDEDLLAAGPGPAPGGPAGAGLSRIVIEEIE